LGKGSPLRWSRWGRHNRVTWYALHVAGESAARVRAIYSRWAFAYDAFTWLTERSSLRDALDMSALRDGEAFLEVAVGTGVAFRDAVRRNPRGRNVGVDLTEAMLRRARAKATRTGVPFELTIGDARSLPFAAETFDVVMNNNMLGLVPDADLEPIIGEMARVLRKGGRLVVVTMMRPHATLPRWFYEVVPNLLGGWRDVVIEPVVAASGLHVAERRVVTQLGVPSEILVARKP